MAVGTISPDEAQACLELFLAIRARRKAEIRRQETRSKAAVKSRP